MKDQLMKEVELYRKRVARIKREGSSPSTITLEIDTVEMLLDYIEKTKNENEEYFDIRMEAVKLLPAIERFIQQGFSYNAIQKTEELLNRIIGKNP